MKRKYKKALQDCFEPPAPQRKAQFLQKIQAEQSQDTATPLFFQRYPKWIRQSAMVFCAAAVLGIGYGAYQAFFDSRDQLEVVPPPETTTTAWIEPDGFDTTALEGTLHRRTSPPFFMDGIHGKLGFHLPQQQNHDQPQQTKSQQ